tara:strand:- start:1303 stop:1485 length:183 start_codon:yes stop_codon:yes gene_type:complete
MIIAYIICRDVAFQIILKDCNDLKKSSDSIYFFDDEVGFFIGLRELVIFFIYFINISIFY